MNDIELIFVYCINDLHFPVECIDPENDRDGSSYRGVVARTRSGHVCQRWDVQSPNMHKQKPSEYVIFLLVMSSFL